MRFEVSAALDHLRQCDCSICRRRGALIHRIPNHEFRLASDWSDLTEYRWGSRTAVDYFCSRCGILGFRRPSAPSAAELAAGMQRFTGWAINVRCLDGIDINELRRVLPRVAIHGAALDLPSVS